MNFTGVVGNVAGSLSGRVTMLSIPVAGVLVQALQGGSLAGSASSDTDGYYRIGNLANGSYSLVAAQTGYSISPLSLNVASVPSSGNNFSLIGPNPAPVIAAATASPEVVSSSSATTTLSAVASGLPTLRYSWDALNGSAPVSFSANDSSAASSTTVSFQVAGNYLFRVRVTDGNGLSATGNVSVTVNAGQGPMAVSPYQVQLAAGQKVAFRANAWDQVGNQVSAAPSWSASGGGSIDSSGVYSATVPGGPYMVIASAGGLSATGFVWVAGSQSLVPPTITTQPSYAWLAAGSTATFNLVVNGTQPLSYQWMFNGTAIPGATDSTYLRTNVQTIDAGNYSVQVTNAAGALVSSNAVLAVNNPPSLASIGDRTIHQGMTLTITNMASDPDIPAQTLTFSMDPGFPPEATIEPTTGVFSWSSIGTKAGTTNPAAIRVTDNGIPSLSTVKSFNIMVIEPLRIQVTAATNSQASITWSSIPGTTYRVQFKESLDDLDWTTLSPDMLASDNVTSFTEVLQAGRRFFRVSIVQ